MIVDEELGSKANEAWDAITPTFTFEKVDKFQILVKLNNMNTY